MSFLMFLLIVLAILQVTSYFAFSKDFMPFMWVVVGIASVLAFVFYNADVLAFLQYDLLKFAIIYLISGIIYAASSALVKAFYLSNKMKREWAEFRIDPKYNEMKTDELKIEFVSKFSKENNLSTGDDIFYLETTPSYYSKNDPQPTIVKSGVYSYNFLPRIANWAIFWPFFLFSFITYDAFKLTFSGLANLFKNSYDSLIKRLFNNIIK